MDSLELVITRPIKDFEDAVVLVDCEQSLFCSKSRGEKEAEHESRASGEAASSARGTTRDFAARA